MLSSLSFSLKENLAGENDYDKTLLPNEIPEIVPSSELISFRLNLIFQKIVSQLLENPSNTKTNVGARHSIKCAIKYNAMAVCIV